MQQGGRNRHEHICESLELFAAEVMPHFKAKEAEREAAKAAELAPYIEAALARKQRMAPLADDQIPTVVALGRQIAEEDQTERPKEGVIAFGKGSDMAVALEDPADKQAAGDD